MLKQTSSYIHSLKKKKQNITVIKIRQQKRLIVIIDVALQIVCSGRLFHNLTVLQEKLYLRRSDLG